jgi:UDP-GlcNAc3NAcA epimerase
LLHMQPEIVTRLQTLLPELKVERHNYVLVTIHRAANTDDPTALHTIASALNRLEIPVLFPVHPRTRARLEQYNISWKSHIQLIEPVGYIDMLALESAAERIFTDSGGVQKEAFLLGTPCVTLREETEWPETVAAGWNVLVGINVQSILGAAVQPRPAAPHDHPFGVGDAALRIAQSFS